MTPENLKPKFGNVQMNPLSPEKILRNLDHGYFMTHEEQAEAAQYIRQLQQENLTLLAKPEQEAGKCGCGANLYIDENGKPCSKIAKPVRWFQQFGDAPPRKEWVNLTEDEVFEFLSDGVDGREDINNIEEALRRKNGAT